MALLTRTLTPFGVRSRQRTVIKWETRARYHKISDKSWSWRHLDLKFCNKVISSIQGPWPLLELCGWSFIFKWYIINSGTHLGDATGPNWNWNWSGLTCPLGTFIQFPTTLNDAYIHAHSHCLKWSIIIPKDICILNLVNLLQFRKLEKVEEKWSLQRESCTISKWTFLPDNWMLDGPLKRGR